MAEPLRVACIGAGSRALAAHYPCIQRLAESGAVTVVGVCDLDPVRRARGGDLLGLPIDRRYVDLDALLAEARPQLAYAIMGPRAIRPVAERVLAAGVHVVVEKPPGATLDEVRALASAARAAGCQGMVAFQRRWAAVVQETRRRIAERGPLTTCVVQFHKDMRGLAEPAWGVSTLWEDIVHVVDLARYLCGGAVVDVQAYRDAHDTSWPNVYTALVRFDNGATALISGNRASGGRFLRVEAHGRGLGAYMDDFPARLRLLVDNQADLVLSGHDLAGSPVEAEWDGLMAMHRHFVACASSGTPALTSFDDALETMALIDRIEQAADR